MNSKISLTAISITAGLILGGCQPAPSTDTLPIETPKSTPTSTQSPTSPSTTPSSNTDAVTITYQPKQCVETPWEEWSKTSPNRYIKAPTDAEIITDYLASNQIDVKEVKKIQPDRMVCEACGTCDTVHFFEAKVSSQDLAKVKALNWKQKE